MDINALRREFPFPEYRIVLEAIELNILGRGPLLEHGTLAGRKLVHPGQEPAWRDAVAGYFAGNALDEANPGPFMKGLLALVEEFIPGVVDEGEEPIVESVADASLNEQLVFMSGLPFWKSEYAAKYGIREETVNRARGIRLIENDRFGFPRFSTRKGWIHQQLIENLEVGQSVFRMNNGKVERVNVVAVNGDKVVVAGGVGSEVQEVPANELADEDDNLSAEAGTPTKPIGGSAPNPNRPVVESQVDRLLAESPIQEDDVDTLTEGRRINHYSAWRRAVFREHKSAKISGDSGKAIATFKGRQFATWDGQSGEVF